RLHESGVYVMGVGEKTTPVAFRNACDEFVFLENLNKNTEVRGSAENEKNNAKKEMQVSETAAEYPQEEDIKEIHKLLRIAWDKYQENDGYVNVSSAGQYIKRAKPDFDARTYGFSKLPDLVEAFPKKYSMKRYKGKGTVTIIAYKCI